MANSQLIKGAFLAAPKFTDTSQAINQAINQGKTALLERQAQEKRRQELQARAISQLPALDESQIPSQLRKWATGKALEARQGAVDIIQDKTLNPAEKQMQLLKYKDQISQVATKATDFKQWIANFADIEQDDLSQLNNSELMNRVNDIYEGRFMVQGDNFIFSDGTIKKFDSLVNTRPIIRRSDAFKNQLVALQPAFDKLGLSGRSVETFQANLDIELAKTNYTDADLASIAVDELGRTDLLTEQDLSNIKEDFEVDGRIDNSELKGKIVKAITDEYTNAAKTAYNNGFKDRNAALKKAKKETKPESINNDILVGVEEAQQLINDPAAYFSTVSGSPTEYNKKLKRFSIMEIVEDDKGNKTQQAATSYNLTQTGDIIRLFRDIQSNAGYTATKKDNLLKGLKILLKSPAYSQYQSQVQQALNQDVPTEQESSVDTGNLPIQPPFTQT
jgi:hypothetical protein